MIYTLGESLMDIIITANGHAEIKAGGSLLNVAVSLGRSEKTVAIISEVGADPIGQMLTDFLLENGVATQWVHRYSGGQTSLAIATLSEQKKPSYSFYKAYPVNRSLKEPPKFLREDIFVFGSLYSCDPEIKIPLNKYVENARKAGATIIYDPNVRYHHVLSRGASRGMLLDNLAVADIIKGSDEDFENIFDTDNILEIKNKLRRINQKAILVITRGENGSIAFYGDTKTMVPAINTEVVSTIGAGDAFTAGMINALVTNNLSGKPDEMTIYDLRKILMEGTRFSSMVCATIENYIPAG